MFRVLLKASGNPYAVQKPKHEARKRDNTAYAADYRECYEHAIGAEYGVVGGHE